MRYFLDTNIILDFVFDSRKNHRGSRLMIKEISIRDTKKEFWIDRDSISTIDYILRKEHMRTEVVREIIKNFKIANSINILEESINISQANKLDYEDVVKVKTAEDVKAVMFITEDKKLLKAQCFSITLEDTNSILIKFGYEKNLIGEFIKKTKRELRREINEKYAKLIKEADEGSVYIIMERMQDELKKLDETV